MSRAGRLIHKHGRPVQVHFLNAVDLSWHGGINLSKYGLQKKCGQQTIHNWHQG